jgi:hypothetical protein
MWFNFIIIGLIHVSVLILRTGFLIDVSIFKTHDFIIWIMSPYASSFL